MATVNQTIGRTSGRLASSLLVNVVLVAFPLMLLVLVVFGPWITPFSATDFDPQSSLLSPGGVHVFGTDEFGRDVFSRIVAGARPTLLPALASTIIGIGLGIVTGLAAGYFGGRWDEIIMRAMDVLLSFPALILSMLVVVMMGSSFITLIMAIGIVFWPRSARLIRSMALELSRKEFIDAARARGETAIYVMYREILPNMWSLIIVDFTLRCANAVLLVASLSYLGIGVSPPTPAWGLMVKEGQPLLQIAPWIVIFPCLVIAVVSIGLVLFGESVRSRLTISDRKTLS